MADNYLQFSQMIKCRSQGEIDWLREHLDIGCTDEENDEGIFPPCDYQAIEGGVWVNSDDWSDVGVLSSVVAEYQRQFDVGEPWSLEYAATCSKPWLGQFGGGAVVVYKGECHYQDSSEFVHNKIVELAEEEA